MRQLMAGLVIMALGVTGCATSATTGGGQPAAATSHGATPAARTSSTAAAPGLGGLAGGGSAGLAQWVVDGTFEKAGAPLPGVVTFRDRANGNTVTVTVGASGKFSVGLVAGTYTATGQAQHSNAACAAPVTFTVRAGQPTRVALICPATS